MTTSRKILAGVVVAAGLTAAAASVYADAPGGFWRGGWGGHMGPGMMYQGGGYGPGMMGWGGPQGGFGPGMMGYGPGMMGYGPGMMGYGPGAAAGVPCDGFGPGAAAAGPVERTEQRLAFLKNQLKITSDQESAWNAYAAQAKTQAESMQAFFAQPPSAAQSATERMEQRAELMNLRAKQITALNAAVKDLYAVLTPEQKAVADLHFGGRRFSQGPRGYAR